MANAHVQYQATINENHAPTLPTTLKVTSGSNGFRIMDPFDWTRDKSIYQRWQLWSHKARLTFDAMEGDSENTRISYFHHWINGEGISQIEGWKNNKILISQGRATDQSVPVERMRHRIKQECTLNWIFSPVYIYRLLLISNYQIKVSLVVQNYANASMW